MDTGWATQHMLPACAAILLELDGLAPSLSSDSDRNLDRRTHRPLPNSQEFVGAKRCSPNRAQSSPSIPDFDFHRTIGAGFDHKRPASNSPGSYFYDMRAGWDSKISDAVARNCPDQDTVHVNVVRTQSLRII